MRLKDNLALIFLGFREYFRIKKSLKNLYEYRELSIEDRSNYRVSKIKGLLNVSLNEVRYYNEKYGDVLRDVLSMGDDEIYDGLQKLPIIQKEEMRSVGSDFWNHQIKNYFEASTGGTTGVPLRLRKDADCNAITKAALFRAKMDWGVRPFDRMIYLISFGKGSFLGKLRMRLGRKVLLDAFPSNQEEIENAFLEIRKYKPRSIEGFASGILSLMNVSIESKASVPVIISTGEMLFDYQREELVKFFDADVYTYYGSNEVGSIAYECKYHKLHVCEEHVHLETVDDNGISVLGEEGRVVVTDLDNKAMPFIRYELGDLAVLEKVDCPCGQGGTIISRLVGRNQDFLSSIDGNRLQSTQLVGFLKDLQNVGSLQFVQFSEKEVKIYFDGDLASSKGEMEFVCSHVRERLGSNVVVSSEWVNSIPRTKRGKQPLIVRKI